LELQSRLVAQADPIGYLPQLIAVQTFGDVQSVLAPQVVRQAVPPQTYGVQEDVVPATHLPAPSQRLEAVTIDPAQLCARQTVPLE
jgi:hypothetical protein